MATRNEERANRAATTMQFYKAEGLGEAGPVCEDTLADLLTDMRHWCSQNNVRFERLICLSIEHWFNEEANSKEE